MNLIAKLILRSVKLRKINRINQINRLITKTI